MPVKKYKPQRHPYYSYKSHSRLPSQKSSKNIKMALIVFLLIPCVIAGYVYYLYIRPLPAISPVSTVVTQSKDSPAAINWPDTSQAAIGSVEQGVLAKKPNQVVRPTASTAKLITVLTVLDHKPLRLGEQGPLVTMTQNDVNRFNAYTAIDGASAQVVVGEKLSQYQLIQGTLLPSANNYADTLAVWAFGSLEKYQTAAKSYVKKINAKNTTVGTDASGFSDTTTSTAEDLVRIGIEAAKNPVIAQIMSQSEVQLPVAGTKVNTNWLLGEEGVVGGKTGNTEQAGGVYVFVSKYRVDEKETTIVGAIQGESNVYQAIIRARQLLVEVKPHFTVTTPIKKDSVVGVYTTPWGQKTNAIAEKDIQFVSWKGTAVTVKNKLHTINVPYSVSASVGNVSVNNISSPVKLKDPIHEPSSYWRIFR